MTKKKDAYVPTVGEEVANTVTHGVMSLLALVALSVLYVALLCFVPETGWYSDVYPWAYRNILETAQFWT